MYSEGKQVLTYRRGVKGDYYGDFPLGVCEPLDLCLDLRIVKGQYNFDLTWTARFCRMNPRECEELQEFMLTTSPVSQSWFADRCHNVAFINGLYDL